MELVAKADVVLFDATLFTDDEMIATGTGVKTGRRMGQIVVDKGWVKEADMHAALGERVLLQLRALMEDAAKADPATVAGKVGAYYAAFMDEARTTYSLIWTSLRHIGRSCIRPTRSNA